jgi:septal ring factor EnvC (AmiA/AmiB activator)
MDEVEKSQIQDLNSYTIALENTVEKLNKSLEVATANLAKIQKEKEALFEDFVNSLYKIYNIGE